MIPQESKSIPEIRRLAETRAEEISNGTKTLNQLTAIDQEHCWASAEAEAISRAERYVAATW